MKLTLNVLEKHPRDAGKHWPGYMFGGRVRTSTLILIVAFFATWWAYNTYKPHPQPPAAPAVIPPGFVPDPNYTWVPRTRVRPPTYDTPTYRPTTTVPTTTPPPPTTTTTTTTTPPPLFQLPTLPPPFGPPTTAPAPPPGQPPAPSAPPPALPWLPGLAR